MKFIGNNRVGRGRVSNSYLQTYRLLNRHTKRDQKKLFFLINLLKKALKEISCIYLLKKLPNSFYSVLTGLSDICQLYLSETETIDLQLLIIYLRLIGGIDILLTKKNSSVFFININNRYENSEQYSRKIDKYDEFRESFTNKSIESFLTRKQQYYFVKKIILDLLLNRKRRHISSFKFISEGFIKNLVILTHNRPLELEICLKKYIENFYKFGHKNINIIISDDSDDKNSINNKIIVEKIKNIYPYIIYLGKDERDSFIREITEKALTNIPNIQENFLRNKISYIFGGSEFPSTVGRNRNFVSFYLKNKAFISVDDDSFPEVRTYEKEILKNAVKKLTENNLYDLNKVENFISESDTTNTHFLSVDLAGHFENANPSILKYVKYSGIEDGDLITYILNKSGLDKDTKIPDISKTLIHMNKLRSPNVQGLCIFFPADNFKLRITLPDDIRVEDTYIGYNYYLETGRYPVSTNMALFHNKETEISKISIKEIHKDLLSMIFYNLYTHLVNRSVLYNENIFVNVDKGIIIYENFWKLFHEEVNNVLGLLEYVSQIYSVEDNLKKSETIKAIKDELKKEIYSVSLNVYHEQIEILVNKILKNYLESVKLWMLLDKLFL